MDINTLSVHQREIMGKSYARKLRREGRAPALAYSKGETPYHFDLDPKELLKVLHSKGKNAVLTLKFDKDLPEQVAMLRKIQRHPISREVLHVDFKLIELGKPVQVKVRLNFDGRPLGVQLGGMVEVIRREMEVECLPVDIPQEIKVDITELDLGAVLHISDVELPEGIKVLDDPHYTLLTISDPKIEEASGEEDEEEDEEVEE